MNSNPKVTQIALNGNTGLMVNIVMTIMASKVEVMEDPSVNAGAPQGLQGYYIDVQPPQGVIPVSVNVIPAKATPQALQVWLANNNGQLGRAYQPILFGGSEGGRVHGGLGEYVGADGTVILQLRSNSPTATQVLLVEYA